MIQTTRADDLTCFFEPKSIAVVGASRDPSKWGHVILRNIKEYGFKGKLYPINPKAKNLLGLHVYPTVSELPDEIDLAIIQVKASKVSDAVRRCVEKHVKGIVIISAGFSETGEEGANLEEEVVKIAKSGNIRIIGPNGMGIFNSWNRMNATMAQLAPKEGYISFVSQSGAYGISIFTWAHESDIGFSKFVSIGNRCDIDEADLLEYFKRDSQTRVICLYLEGLDDGRKFLETARKVSLSKPICVMKTGKSDIGARAARSHTGVLAGSDEIYTAAFKQSGIIRVQDVDELFDYAKAFASQPLPKSNKVAIISNSGGPAVAAADACEEYCLKLPEFSKLTKDRLETVLPPFASITNPLDTTATRDPVWYTTSTEIILQDQNIDGVIIYAPTTFTSEVFADTLIQLHMKYTKPVVVSWNPAKTTKRAIAILEKGGIPVYTTPRRAVKAMAALTRSADFQRKGI